LSRFGGTRFTKGSEKYLNSLLGDFQISRDLITLSRRLLQQLFADGFLVSKRFDELR